MTDITILILEIRSEIFSIFFIIYNIFPGMHPASLKCLKRLFGEDYPIISQLELLASSSFFFFFASIQATQLCDLNKVVGS